MKEAADGMFPRGEPYVLHAARNGNYNVLKMLLHVGANPNVVNVTAPVSVRYEPCAWAAINGHINCVKLLLQYGGCFTANDVIVLRKKFRKNVTKENELITMLIDHWGHRLYKAVYNVQLKSVNLILKLNQGIPICNYR